MRRSLIALALALLSVTPALADPPCEDVVCVEVENTGGDVTFYAISKADGVSISFSVSAVNMEPASPPMLVRSLSHGRTQLMTLKAIPGKKPQFSHGFFWEWGIVDAKHDDRVSYRLPYESRQTFRLFQGPEGALSHQGVFAYDFPMPIGTPVCAARRGRVIQVVDEFGEGGADLSFGPMANGIQILHEDGTIGWYLHLLQGGMHVKVLDEVEAGTIIGTSGNSGRTSGPHLHFEVFGRTDRSKRQTFAIKFHTAGKDDVVLEEGKSYCAE